MEKAVRMRQTGQQIPELSDEAAARILKNVFAACGVPENKTPFQELKQRCHGKEQRKG